MIVSTDVTQLTLTLKMTTAQVVETSVTVNSNSPIQDYVHPDDQTQPFETIVYQTKLLGGGGLQLEIFITLCSSKYNLRHDYILSLPKVNTTKYGLKLEILPLRNGMYS